MSDESFASNCPTIILLQKDAQVFVFFVARRAKDGQKAAQVHKPNKRLGFQQPAATALLDCMPIE